ncbi:hypothetical protein EAX38_19135 [Salmonella enterica]|nr:hypothetical protein [Salmonella enterica]
MLLTEWHMLWLQSSGRGGKDRRSGTGFFRICAEKEEPEGVFHSEQLAQKCIYDIFTFKIL